MEPEPDSPVARATSATDLFQPNAEQAFQILHATGCRLQAEVVGGRAVSVEQSLADLAAQRVEGVFVTLKRSGSLRSCCGSLGPAIPLGQAIEQAVVAAASHDRRFPPISPAELPFLTIDVTLLGAVRRVEAKGRDRLNAIVVGTHGLRIIRGECHGLLLPVVAVEHQLGAEEFLELVCRKAGLPPDAWQADDAILMTFEGHALRSDLGALLADAPGFRSIPAPNAGSDVRPAAVAGGFYPGQPKEIDRMLDAWFVRRPEPEPWAAALVPHAGWQYSGRLAAEVLGRVRFPGCVIIFAPRHRGEGANWAVSPHRAWQIPGRRIEADRELAERLAASIQGLELDAAAHAREHAIEVQLPLVARLAPQSRVVGITVHSGNLDALQRFGSQLADTLGGLSQRPLLVISSDMNHFADERETRRRDRLALDALAALDPERLYRTVHDHRISMCGALPAVVVLTALRRLGNLTRCCEVGYSTSAAVSHDTQRCVGYAGMLFA